MIMKFKISPKKQSRNVSVSFSADRFERVAADFGLFNSDFLKSIDRAERDIRARRTKEISSLRQLRTK